MGQPTGEPTPDTGAPTPVDPTSDTGGEPDWKAEAEKFKALARKHEDRAKSNADAAKQVDQYKQQYETRLAEVAKLLGIQNGDEPPDPAQLTQHLESAQAAAWRSGVELAVFRSAGSLGGDPEKLLDSLAFVDSLDDLVEMDSSSQDFRTALEAKVREAIERNPAYRSTQTPAAPRPDPSQGPRSPGAAQRPKSLSEAVKAAWDASKQTPGR